MSFISGNLRTANAVLLVLTLPIMVRLWVEAVLWRLERGPQAVFFSLMRAGAGALTPVLLLSLLAVYVYWFWVAIVTIRWLIPKQRPKLAGVIYALTGAVTVFAFFELARLLQYPLGSVTLYAGVTALTALGVSALALVALGVLPSNTRLHPTRARAARAGEAER